MTGDPGDILEVESWIGAYQGIVYRAAGLILRDPEAAADVAQEVFIRAYLATGHVPPGTEIAPWLYRIAVNLSLNRLRSKRREERALEQVVQGPELVEEPSEHDVNSRLTVAEALRRLPDRLRVTVVLRYYLDLSEEEMAHMLGVRAGTIKSRLHEARKRLALDDAMLTAGRE